MFSFFYNNNRYNISGDLWKKYCLMHPVRTREALLSTLKICYANKIPTLTEIEQLIEEEYNLHSNMDAIMEQAKEKYDITNKHRRNTEYLYKFEENCL